MSSREIKNLKEDLTSQVVSSDPNKKRKAAAGVQYAPPTKAPSKQRRNELLSLKEMDPSQRSFEESKILARHLHESATAVPKSSGRKWKSNSASRMKEVELDEDEKLPTTVSAICSIPGTSTSDIFLEEEIILNEEYKKVFKNLKVTSFEDFSNFVSIGLYIQEEISKDTHLKDHYNRSFQAYIDRGTMRTMAKRLHLHCSEVVSQRKSNKKENKNPRSRSSSEEKDKIGFTNSMNQFSMNVKYMPPSDRLSIKIGEANIWGDIYCDLPRGSEANFSISMDSFYIYGNRNRINIETDRELVQLTKEAETKSNLLKCECCEGGSVKPCWQNPSCNCYKVNEQLRRHQNHDFNSFNGTTNFSTFEPILFHVQDHYFDTIGFACSELCGCKGECTNNVTLMLEKEFLFPVELFRKNEILGFGVRAMAAIPVGTPIMEFVGDIVNDMDLRAEDQNYTFSFINKDDCDTFNESFLSFNEKWKPPFKKNLVRHLKQTWHINPKRFGNKARTFCHSCEPNLTLVRVFQKGFSPAHVRLLVVTLENIFPGVELTFDYGKDYLKSLKCVCKRIGCESNEEFEEVSKVKESALQSYYALRHFNEYKRFEKIQLAIEQRMEENKELNA